MQTGDDRGQEKTGTDRDGGDYTSCGATDQATNNPCPDAQDALRDHSEPEGQEGPPEGAIEGSVPALNTIPDENFFKGTYDLGVIFNCPNPDCSGQNGLPVPDLVVAALNGGSIGIRAPCCHQPVKLAPSDDHKKRVGIGDSKIIKAPMNPGSIKKLAKRMRRLKQQEAARGLVDADGKPLQLHRT